MFGLADLGGPYYISGNEVVCENPDADCIFLFETRGSVIAGNHVVMRDVTYGAISLFDDVSESYVGQNRIEESGGFALDIFGIRAFNPIARANTFVGNDVARFQSAFADVFLDVIAEANVLAGYSGSVQDAGVNNRVTGFTKHGGAPGQQIRDGQAGRHELLRLLGGNEWPER